MNKHLFLILALLLPFHVFNQTVTWDKTYNYNEYDMAMSIKPTFDNGYIVAGRTGTMDTTDIWIFKLNEFGDTVWTKTYGGIYCEAAYSIIQTGDGDYVISGYKSPSCFYYDYNIYVIKINEVGNVIWDFEYSGGNRVGYDIIETFDGGYLILGNNFAGAPYEIILVKLNHDGELVWDKTYDLINSPSLMYEVIQTQDSGFALVGEKANNMSEQDIWILKTDNNGDSLWSQTFDYQEDAVGRSIKQLDDGDFIIAANGGSDLSSYSNLLTCKLSATGEQKWMFGINLNASFYSHSIIPANDGSLLTIGRMWQQVGVRGIFALKQEPWGDTIWMKTFEKGADGCGMEVHQTADQGYIIGGYVSNNGPGSDKDGWILKLDENGLVGIQNEGVNIPQSHVDLYPNPAKGFCYLKSKRAESWNKISVFNQVGQKVMHQNKVSHTVDISWLNPGLYIVEIIGDGWMEVKKLIIK